MAVQQDTSLEDSNKIEWAKRFADRQALNRIKFLELDLVPALRETLAKTTADLRRARKAIRTFLAAHDECQTASTEIDGLKAALKPSPTIRRAAASARSRP